MRGDILVVDDEAGPRESLRMILKQDHDVRTADGGIAAIREVDERSPDLVFLDLRMPDMDGAEVLKAVKAKHPEVEVAIITAYADVDSARLAVRLGAIDYLTKPYAVADVERIVDRALGARRRQHDAEILAAQLAKMTDSLMAHTGSLDVAGRVPVADALDSLQSIQSSLDEDLESVRELSELGEIAAEVTHDISNLLTVILTSSQFLLRQIDGESQVEPDAISARVSTVVTAARDCSQIIRRIKDYARLNVEREFAPVDLNDLVTTAVELKREASGATGKDVEFRLRLGAVPSIHGDDVALRNVLVNLIENGLDALHKDGFIELATQCTDGWVRVTVRDNGAGMSAEEVENATRAFFSRRKAHGTGLGLSIADKVVHRHHGKLVIDSAEGRGTTITIDLPVEAPRDPVEGEGPTRAVEGTVVLVEDDEPMRQLMAALLEAEGYEVLATDNGHDAWSLYEEVRARKQDAPLTIVTDYEMSEMSGRDLAVRVKEVDDSTPVLIVSGYITENDGPEDALVTKPFEIEELLSRVRELMSRGREG